MPSIQELGENGLLRLLSPTLREHTEGLVLPTGDDVAISLPPARGGRVVWTIDSMIEGTHFRFWTGTSPRDLGYKLAISNLSDLASKGATPWGALLSLGVPGEAQAEDVQSFLGGLSEALESAGGHLLGGDTVRAPQWSLSLALLGTLESEAVVAARGNAMPGMGVYVTGTLGDARAGLELLESGIETAGESSGHLIGRFLRPTARLHAGSALVRHCPVLAMMDLSDGLATDAARMAEASGVSLRIEASKLPVSNQLVAHAEGLLLPAWEYAARGGEDYELLFATTLDEQQIWGVFEEAGCQTPVVRIGTIEDGDGVQLLGADGALYDLTSGFEHFQ